MGLSTVRHLLARHWQRFMFYAALIAGAGGLLFYQLHTLPGGYGAAELATTQQASSWQHILDAPLNAPFLTLVQALSYVVDDKLLASRLVAGACGLAVLILFYTLTRYWHGERVAIFGTVLFGTSAWFLHITRLGTPEILLCGPLALTACYLWLRRTGSSWALLTLFVLGSVLVYVPGMIWFIVIGIVAQWRTIDRYFMRNLWAVTAGALIVLAALIPLGLAVYHDPDIARLYAGFPLQQWPVPLDVLRSMADIPLHLFIAGPPDPQRWLGTLPILDFFTIAMCLLGVYLYSRHARLGRFWMLAVVLALGTLLASLGGQVTVTILIPFIYMLAAAGIGFMLDRWTTVFPRNIFARYVGYGMLCVAVLTVGVYSFRHYFVAWPQAPATKAVYTIHPSPSPSGTIKE